MEFPTIYDLLHSIAPFFRIQATQEILTYLSNRPEVPILPSICAHTANTQDDETRQYYQAGMVEVFAKPTRISKLEDFVLKTLEEPKHGLRGSRC